MFSKMCSKKFLVLCLYLMILDCSYGQREKKFFRKDYKYFEDSQSFYKLHKERKTWADAKKICALEGATFFYPDSTQASFMSWWNSTEGYDNYYIGVSSFPSKGVFETIDGRSILDVYNKWSEGQPDHYNNAEDCVEIRRTTGTLNDVECTRELPFICKKTLASLEWNEQCNSPNLDYHYDEEFDRCYKFHTTPLPWPEAHFVCAGELSYLAVPNSQREADLLVNITASTPKNEVLIGTVHLGFHNRMGDGWQTFRGSSLYDSGNTKWALNQLDGEVKEQCGSMFYNGTLKDIDCKTRSFFICEHEIDDDGQLDKKFFRKDYKYFEDSQSFYKIHNEHKTWADAKNICALEGATFFYPDSTQASFMSWWNSTQAYEDYYIGVSSLVAEGVFETIDGSPILDVYNKWEIGQPDYNNNNEDCVEIKRTTGTLNDVECTRELPFICKKTLASLEYNQPCDSPNLDGQRDKKFFRKDYKYFEDSQSFYKIHNEHKTWADAKKICALEGASFFYPDSTQASFMSWWTSTQNYEDYHIGVSSLVVKGVFETIDGRNILDVYNEWGIGRPDYYNDGAEDCVEIKRSTGTLNDVECALKFPFICKKTLASLEWNQLCNSPNLDYHYDEEFDRCYKFHTTPLPWPEAHAVCAAELSYLAVPNSQREADLLVNITASTPKDEVLSGTVHLGFHNRMGDGWQTFKNSSLYDRCYNNWAPNQLKGEVREQCGSMFYNGTLKDIDCKTRSFFICEHEIDILSTSNDEKSDVETVAVNL